MILQGKYETTQLLREVLHSNLFCHGCIKPIYNAKYNILLSILLMVLTAEQDELSSIRESKVHCKLP